MQKMKSLSDPNLYWMVGLLEGEGCFHDSPASKGGKRYPRIVLHMTDEDIIDRFVKLTGAAKCELRPRLPHHKVHFAATISGPKAINLMRLVMNHMGKRRQERIRIILESTNISSS